MSRELYAHDQFGDEFGPLDPARPKASLLKEMGRRSACPMYHDTKTGAEQIGYVVKPVRGSGECECWCRLYWQQIDPWISRR